MSIEGIELDPNNKPLWSALTACQAAFELDKKHRFAAAEIERKREEERLKRQSEIKKEIELEKHRQKVEEKEEELLSGFFTEMGQKNEQKNEENNETNFIATNNGDLFVYFIYFWSE
jgi:hypothetical protein